MVKYGSYKASLTFNFTDYPKLDAVNFNVGGVSYKRVTSGGSLKFKIEFGKQKYDYVTVFVL
jgi:hypothetical protein